MGEQLESPSELRQERGSKPRINGMSRGRFVFVILEVIPKDLCHPRDPWLFYSKIIGVHSCEFVVRDSDCNGLTIQRFNDGEGTKQNPLRTISDSTI